MNSDQKIDSKILSVSDLAKKVATLKKKNPKIEIVFTNGCFDILHRGHVTYLNQAASEGQYLIVALNSDDSVKKLKGPSRPVNSLEDRLYVMAGLGCVDFVTSFTDDTPLEIIKEIKPSVLVKGGDWKIEQIVGAKEVLSWGGRVKSLSFVDGKSTTSMIDKIKDQT